MTKLELTWIGKADDPAPLEPRIFLDSPQYSFGEVETGTLSNGKPWLGNMLIHGDNLLALKALEQDFSGQIKCIYIDPPYNTGHAFEQYDDNVEHSLWLTLMRDRLIILHKLLSEDGSLWVTLDDCEAHYFKVLCDEIFGRSNFVASTIWQHAVQSKGYPGKFSLHHNYTFCYRKSDKFSLNSLERTAKHNVNYSNPDNDPNGPWRSGDVRNSLVRPNLMYDIETPSGKIIHHPEKGWRFSRETFEHELSKGKIKFSDDESRIIRKIYLKDQQGRVPETLWFAEEVGTTREANGEIKSLDLPESFDTPKPEKLIERVLILATNPNDIVLDSFVGSGTTAAVAHKMNRRWIAVELGDHAYTVCQPRLQKVVEGEQGGISKAQNWQGGGGFKFYELAPSLLNHDKHGNLVINKEYNADMLAAAMAKHQGFTYSPDEELYWKQGRSSERDFIFTTTQLLTSETLEAIHEQMGENESLLICCTKFQPECRNHYSNITIKKIPKVLLDTCEFDRDDYSLNIVSVPDIEDEEWDDFNPEVENDETSEFSSNEQITPSLFD
ncbi:site-specific DNA-methyltransferase [Bacteroides caecimuris]|uniref:site-specific DNA-methyltransferase n=1 Tax=Bacteroides caecimuris TaxID=1796613 RepID=UPI001433E1D3|nr:site-specific DNA-methyltransferase [Bacteroides caecimuris]GFI54205.1 modification methylase MboII [Alistipes sp.]